MRKTFAAITAAVLGAALLGGAAWAQDGGGDRRGGQGLRSALRALDLDQDQKDQVLAKMSAQREKTKGLREQMKADRQALRAAVDVANPDPTAVGRAFLKVKANREAMKTEMKAFRESIRPILSDEQNAKLDGYVSAMRDRGQRFRGRND